jgi:arylsulfatase A-like enzyme
MEMNYFNKLSVLSTAAVMASTLTFNGDSQAAIHIAKEKGPSKKESKLLENNNDNQTEPMNVIYIVLDDSGFSDLGSYGSEIQTPNMDWLAQNGLRYNNAHVTPLCSPTRAALLTGGNAHEVGVGTVENFDLGPAFPNKRGGTDAATIAEVLSEKDYNTYAVGKWHLAPTHQTSPAGPFDHWPLQKGFHQYYGFLEDSSHQYKPDLTIDNTQIPSPMDENYHFSEAIVENANRYITNLESAYPDKPFFLYLAFGAQHSPHQVPQKYIDMYKGVYDKGWDDFRQERFKKQKELGLIPKGTKLPPRAEDVKPWNELSETEKEIFIRFQETYAGMLTHADEQVGKLLDNLRRTDQLDNTMIFLLSDNGASASGRETGFLNFTNAINGWYPTIDELAQHYKEIGSGKVWPDYPKGGAQVSNTPFRGFKNSTFEGGVHVPLIVYHPTLIKDPGSIRSQYVNSSDITPTVYDILGISPPRVIKGEKELELSGKSFKGSLMNREAAGRDTQYFETSGHRAIYHDGWKAVADHKKGEPYEKDRWFLFHIDKDFSESTDLAERYPEKLKHLQNMWLKEAEKHDVLPLTDIFEEGFLSIPPDTIRAKKHFTYYRGMDRLTDSAAAPVINRSYEIKIPIERKSPREDGVLLAHGGFDGGYTFYIWENKLVYEYSMGNRGGYKIVSNIDVPIGKSVVTYQFNKTGSNEGNGVLYIDSQKVGQTKLKDIHRYKLSFEGIDVGKDTKTPVSPSYADKGEFVFQGALTKVEYTIRD